MTQRAENNVNGVIASFPLGDTGGVNPQVGVFVATAGSGRLRATVSRKTRLPAIKDRYSYRMGRAIPNPDLNAEQATTIEGGFDGPIGRYGTAAITVFYAAVNDLVQPFFLQPNLFQLQNVGDVRNSGLEAEWRVRPIGDVQGSIGYSYLHRESVSDTAVPLLNTPVTRCSGSSRIPAFRASGWSDRSTPNRAGRCRTMRRAACRWPATRPSAPKPPSPYTRARSRVSATNLLDRNYELSSGFPEPGRVGFVQLRYRF